MHFVCAEFTPKVYDICKNDKSSPYYIGLPASIVHNVPQSWEQTLLVMVLFLFIEIRKLSHLILGTYLKYLEYPLWSIDFRSLDP